MPTKGSVDTCWEGNTSVHFCHHHKINAKRNIHGYAWIPKVNNQHRKLKEKLAHEPSVNRVTTKEDSILLFYKEETSGLSLNNNRTKELKSWNEQQRNWSNNIFMNRFVVRGIMEMLEDERDNLTGCMYVRCFSLNICCLM